MAVIHVPPRACTRCASSEVVAIVPSAETTPNETRVREPRRRLEIPFLRALEQTDRSPGVPFLGLWRVDALRSGI